MAKIGVTEIEFYEDEKVQSYSIELKPISDTAELRLQFNRLYANAKRLHKQKYGNTSIAMCISKNNGDLSKKVAVRTGKRGRPKTIFVRNDESPWAQMPIEHEVHEHIHVVIVGKGSRALAERLVRTENKHIGKCVAKLYSNKGYIPLSYIKHQAKVYRKIGDFEEYLD